MSEWRSAGWGSEARGDLRSRGRLVSIQTPKSGVLLDQRRSGDPDATEFRRAGRGGTRFLRENGFLKKTQVRREQQEKMGSQKSGIRELAPVNPTATVGLQSSLDGS